MYIPANNPNWLLDMPVMVLDPETVDNPDGNPNNAIKNGLKYALTISSIQDVIENARLQDKNADINLFTKAIKYYFENDTFININLI